MTERICCDACAPFRLHLRHWFCCGTCGAEICVHLIRVADDPDVLKTLCVSCLPSPVRWWRPKTLTAARGCGLPADMTNILGDDKQQQVLALRQLGWPLRRIEAVTGAKRT
jgi:hypothetical protein